MSNLSIRTLDELLIQRALEQPDKIAVLSSDGADILTYNVLNQLATKAGQGLLYKGCIPGDRVFITYSNSPLFFAILFACFKQRLIAVPIDPQLTLSEHQALIAHAKPRLVITEANHRSKFETFFERINILSADTLLQPEQSQPTQLPLKQLPLEQLPLKRLPLEQANTIQNTDLSSENDPALLLYTSGTTGEPKGVEYQHRVLINKVFAIKEHFGFDHNFTSLCLLPTHFGHGLICNCLSTFAYGGKLVITRPFDLDLLRQLLPLIEQHQVNTFSSVPTVVRLLLDYASKSNPKSWQSLRFITCASAPLASEEIESFQALTGVPLLNCYGLTETAGWITCSANTSERPLQSVGTALNCEIRIVNDKVQPLEAGAIGEVQVKGPSIMRGYYLNPTLSSEVLSNSWFSTGDIGQLDEKGNLSILSRKKELIIRAGKNIYPAEVDHVLMSHPDIKEACSVGLDDPLLGETVAACIVRKANSNIDEKTIIAYSKEKLGAYKCPQKIKFLDRLPKSNRGKINRASLRPQFKVDSA